MTRALAIVAFAYLMLLKDRSVAKVSACLSRVGEMEISVATTPSRVAMFGWIMPEPLHMPLITNDLPSTVRLRWRHFG